MSNKSDTQETIGSTKAEHTFGKGEAWEPDRSSAMAADYATAALAVVAEEQARCAAEGTGHQCFGLDIFSAMLGGADGSVRSSDDVWGEYLSDGLHLSDSGNEFVFEKLLEAVEVALPTLFA
jgi:lysophospholipase L1-like esterase